jgi:hypothetical protein
MIGSAVTASMLIATYRCPHCGAEQERLRIPAETSIPCRNCLKAFDAVKAEIKRTMASEKKPER